MPIARVFIYRSRNDFCSGCFEQYFTISIIVWDCVHNLSNFIYIPDKEILKLSKEI
jgi:hypothetical protein